jgi:hypothetical protein
MVPCFRRTLISGTEQRVPPRTWVPETLNFCQAVYFLGIIAGGMARVTKMVSMLGHIDPSAVPAACSWLMPLAHPTLVPDPSRREDIIGLEGLKSVRHMLSLCCSTLGDAGSPPWPGTFPQFLIPGESLLDLA